MSSAGLSHPYRTEGLKRTRPDDTLHRQVGRYAAAQAVAVPAWLLGVASVLLEVDDAIAVLGFSAATNAIAQAWLDPLLPHLRKPERQLMSAPHHLIHVVLLLLLLWVVGVGPFVLEQLVPHTRWVFVPLVLAGWIATSVAVVLPLPLAVRAACTLHRLFSGPSVSDFEGASWLACAALALGIVTHELFLLFAWFGIIAGLLVLLLCLYLALSRARRACRGWPPTQL